MIRTYRGDDFDELWRLRQLLYFDHSAEELRDELYRIMHGDPHYDLWTMFVFERADGNLGGFIEIGFIKAGEYRDRLTHFEGTAYYDEINLLLSGDRPIPVVESWYVDEDLRGMGVGKGLMSCAEEWVKANGCPFILSDTDDFREIPKLIYKTLGFDTYHIDEIGCNYFYKRLK